MRKFTAIAIAFLMLCTFIVSCDETIDTSTPEISNTSSSDSSVNVSADESADSSVSTPDNESSSTPEPDLSDLYVPISAGCSYTIKYADTDKYPDTYNMRLTDGMYAPKNSSSSGDLNFVGFGVSGDNDPSITVDLGSVQDDITAFRVSFLSINDAGIKPPRKIKVYISNDGKEWKDLRSMKLNTSAQGHVDTANLIPKEPVSARYVRFDAQHLAAWFFIDEVVVYADREKGDIYQVADGVENEYKNDSYSEYTSNIAKVKSDVQLDKTKNYKTIHQGKTYTLSAKEFPIKELNNSSKKLTNTDFGSSFTDGSWVSLKGDEAHTVVLDLGSVKNNISGFAVSAYAAESGNILLPVYIDISVSEDGKTFFKINRQYSPTAVKSGVYTFSYFPDFCIKARYISFTIGNSNGRITLVSETAVYSRTQDNDDESVVYPDVVIDIKDNGPWSDPSSDIENLILGKPVQIEAYSKYAAVIDSKNNTPASSPILTDGKTVSSHSVTSSDLFHAFSSSGRYFYFDIGHVSALKYATAGIIQNSSENANIPELNVYLSENGVDWYSCGYLFPNRNDNNKRQLLRLDFKETYKARYICFDMTLSGHLYIDELSVFGAKSLDGAVSPSGNKKFDRPTYEYQSPSPDLLKGASDTALVYYNNASLGKEYFYPIVGYIENNEVKDTMFDSFLFLPNPRNALAGGGDPENVSNMVDWVDLQDKLFIDGINLDALNEAAGEVKDALGLENYTYKFFVSIPHPRKSVKNFGDIDGDGQTENLDTVETRVKVTKWYIDRFNSLYDESKYENLEFAGWYWFPESIDIAAKDGNVVKGTSDYLHSIDQQLCWIPWFRSEGHTNWKEYGFDVACMQPNYAFDEGIDVTRLNEAIATIRQHNMGFEMEIDGKAYTDPLFFQKYMDYLSYGVKYGYMKEAIHMYYGAAFHNTYDDYDGYGRIIYEYTYKFIKKTLTVIPDAPASAKLECSKNQSLTHKIIDQKPGYSIQIALSPSEGSAVVNGDGTVSFYPAKDFTGTVYFEVVINDSLGISEPAAIEITVK